MTIPRVGRGPVLKILQWLYAMQELAIAQNLAITSCNDVLQGFDNEGVQIKGHYLLFGRKCVNLSLELRSGSFNDGFYCFWLFSTANVATPIILN